MTTQAQTYETKQAAIAAARIALAEVAKDPMSGVHFRVEKAAEEGRWVWHEINIETGEVATGERIADGAVKGEPAKVTVFPAKSAAKVRKVPTAKASAKSPAPQKGPKRLSKEEREANKAKGLKQAKDIGGNEVWVAPDSPLLVKGVVYPNKARANEARNASATATKRAEKAKAPKEPSKKQVALEAAQRGEMPTAPDFSKETHKRWRKKLQQLVDYVAAGNLRGLKADDTQPLSSSRVMLCRYRDLAIVALEARRKAAKAAPKAA